MFATTSLTANVVLIAVLLFLPKPTGSESAFHHVPPLPLPLPTTDPYPSAPFLKPLPNPPNPVITNADVGQGMSGGPLWKVRNGGEYVMVGVLSTSVSGGSGGTASAYSGGQVLVESTGTIRDKHP